MPAFFMSQILVEAVQYARSNGIQEDCRGRPSMSSPIEQDLCLVRTDEIRIE